MCVCVDILTLLNAGSTKELLQIVSRHRSKLMQTSMITEIQQKLTARNAVSDYIHKSISDFRKLVHDTVTVGFCQPSVQSRMEDHSLGQASCALDRDCRITMNGRIAQLKASCITVSHHIRLFEGLKESASSDALLSGATTILDSQVFFKECKAVILECCTKRLFRLSIEASLLFAKMIWAVGLTSSSSSAELEQVKTVRNDAIDFLFQAKRSASCLKGLEKSNVLVTAIDEAFNLLKKTWYEEVTVQEVAAIKSVLGAEEHWCGFWRICVNGHPVSWLVILNKLFANSQSSLPWVKRGMRLGFVVNNAGAAVADCKCRHMITTSKKGHEREFCPICLTLIAVLSTYLSVTRVVNIQNKVCCSDRLMGFGLYWYIEYQSIDYLKLPIERATN